MSKPTGPIPPDELFLDSNTVANISGRLAICDPLLLFVSIAQQPLAGQGLPHYQGFTITLRHTTLGKTPLDG